MTWLVPDSQRTVILNLHRKLERRRGDWATSTYRLLSVSSTDHVAICKDFAGETDFAGLPVGLSESAQTPSTNFDSACSHHTKAHTLRLQELSQRWRSAFSSYAPQQRIAGVDRGLHRPKADRGQGECRQLNVLYPTDVNDRLAGGKRRP